MSQNIDKSMAYIMKFSHESGGDFRPGGCLYKPISGSQWTPVNIQQASEKTDQYTLAVVLW